MRAEHIKYFLALAENHSITKTAQQFFTTHQSVSKTIRQLEEEMGTQLFERSQKGMFLTLTGERFLPVARGTLDAFHKLRLDIQHLERQREMTGDLSLVGTPITNSVITQPLIDDFRALYPNVRYRIEESTVLDIMQYVSLHRGALGLVAVMHAENYRDFYLPYIDQVQLQLLKQDEYVCLAGVHSPLAANKTVSYKAFLEHPIAMMQMESETSHPFTQLLRQMGNTTPALLTSSPQLYVRAIAYGGYVGISSRQVSSQSVLLSTDDIVHLPFDDDLTLDLALVTNAQPDLDDIAQAFVDLALENAAAQS